jgi:hypothetical protein
MFGHLNAEEFMDLIETGSIAADRQKHLSSCESCENRLQASIADYHSLAVGERDLPEPDWADFRNSVRTSLLSRSVQRESAIRRWTGWSIRPAMAWALGLVICVCLGTGGFLWHVWKDSDQTLTSDYDSQPPAAGSQDIPADSETDLAAWTKAGVFEELAQLDSPQAEHLRNLLQSAQKGSQGQ